MALGCGVYGYKITCPIHIGDIVIEPIQNDLNQAREKARNLEAFELTAIIKGNTIDEDFIFNLEAILSFIEHLDVLITPPIKLSSNDYFAQFPQTIITHKRNNGGGAVISEDWIFPMSRSTFITKTLRLLQDNKFCTETKFNILFFKKIATFRQIKPYIEVTYFLLYSGLESYARTITGDYGNNSSKPIYKLLKNLNFNIEEKTPLVHLGQ